MKTKSNKLQNCFIDEYTNFQFDIKDEDGNLVATAHSLSPKDWSFIKKKAYGKTEIIDGQVNIDIDPYLMNVAMITTSLDSWEFDRKITFDNVNLLSQKYRDILYEAINIHNEKFTDQGDAISGN